MSNRLCYLNFLFALTFVGNSIYARAQTQTTVPKPPVEPQSEEEDVETDTEETDEEPSEAANAVHPVPAFKNWKVKEWPAQVWHFTNDSFNQAGIQLSTALFNATGNIDIITIPIGPAQAKLRSTRNVYDNHDLLGTWTVLDQFNLNGSIPIYNKGMSIPLNPLGFGLGLGFSVSGSTSLNFIDIRQVSSQNHRDVNSIQATVNDLQDSSCSNPDLIQIPVYDPTFYMDPSIRPRFARILNRITFPFRAPFGPKRFLKMANFELISFSGSAQAQMSGGVSTQLTPLSFLNSRSAGASISTDVQAAYTISVMKESDRYAQVKYSRSQTAYSWSAGFSSNVDSVPLIQSFTLIEKPISYKTSPFRIHLSPLDFNYSHHFTRGLDIGYRYDLTTAIGKSAYLKAIHGNFRKSERKAGLADERGNLIIEKIFSSSWHSINKNLHTGLGYQFWKENWDHNRNSFNTDLVLPHGKDRIHRELDNNSNRWLNSLGHYETKNRNFTITLDEKAYADQDPNSFILIAESTIEDSRTHWYEIKAYEKDINATLGKTDIFPAIPNYVPRSRLPKKSKRPFFGSSSFYYGYLLTRPLLEKFLYLPDRQKREALKKTFALDDLNCDDTPPDDGSDENPETRLPTRQWICRFYLRWKAITPDLPLEDKVRRVGKLFSMKNHLQAWMHLPQVALSGEAIDYFITAQSSAFARIQYHSKIVTDADKLLAEANNELNIQNLPLQLEYDNEAQVSSIQATVDDRNRIELNFTLKGDPRWIYFRITKITGWKSSILNEFIYINQNHHFNAGENKISVSPDSPDPLGRSLYQKLKEGGTYNLNLGYSVDGGKWGPGSSTRFQLKELE